MLNQIVDTPSKKTLLGALIGLARATDADPRLVEKTAALFSEGLIALAPSGNTSEKSVQTLTDTVRAKKTELVPSCSTCAAPCGKNDDCDLSVIENADPDIHSLKILLLKKLFALARIRQSGGLHPAKIDDFICRALFASGEDWDSEFLSPLLNEAESLLSGAETASARID